MIPAHILCNPNPETALGSATDSESPTPLNTSQSERAIPSDASAERSETTPALTDAASRLSRSDSTRWPSIQKDSRILAKRVAPMLRVRAAQEGLAKTFERAA